MAHRNAPVFKVVLNDNRKDISHHPTLVSPCDPLHVTRYALPNQKIIVTWEVLRGSHGLCHPEDKLQMWTASSFGTVMLAEQGTNGQPDGMHMFELPDASFSRVFFAYMRHETLKVPGSSVHLSAARTRPLELFNVDRQRLHRRVLVELAADQPGFLEALRDNLQLTPEQYAEQRAQLDQLLSEPEQVRIRKVAALTDGLAQLMWASENGKCAPISPEDLATMARSIAAIETGADDISEAVRIEAQMKERGGAYLRDREATLSAIRKLQAEAPAAGSKGAAAPAGALLRLQNEMAQFSEAPFTQVQRCLDTARAQLHAHKAESDDPDSGPDTEPEMDPELDLDDDYSNHVPPSPSAASVASGDSHTFGGSTSRSQHAYGLQRSQEGDVLGWGLAEALGKKGFRRDVWVPKVFKRHKPVASISAGGGFSALLTTKGQVYSWGSGWMGRLGDSDMDSQKSHSSPHLLQITEDGRPAVVQAVACGSRHAAAISAKGNLYSWGTAGGGELGRFVQGSFDAVPRHIRDVKESVKHVACGHRFTIASTALGALYSWGSNSHQQLGRPPAGRAPGKVVLPEGVKVTKVACGYHFAAALTSAGELLTWGSNEFGQLGHGSYAPVGAEQCVSAPRLVTFFAAKNLGTKASPAPPASAGTAKKPPSATGVAAKVPAASAVKGGKPNAPASGKQSSAAAGAGVRFAAAPEYKNDDASDSNDDDDAADNGAAVQPQLSDAELGIPGPMPRQITQIDCSKGARHCFMMALSKQKEVFIWGAGDAKQLGLPSVDPLSSVAVSPTPAHVRAFDGDQPEWGAGNPTRIACGGAHAAVVTSAGDLFTWGSGRHGVLGHLAPELVSMSRSARDAYTESRPRLHVPLSGKVQDVALGVNHTIVLTKEVVERHG